MKLMTPEQLSQMTEDQLDKRVPVEFRDFRPSKEELMESNWVFYVLEGRGFDMKTGKHVNL